MDVDLSSCPSAGNAPGIVANDFAGNGRRDYAVLVKTKVAKEETIWQDKKLREASLALVLFVDDGDGKYTRRILKRFDDFVPVGAMVKVQPPGAVVDRESNKRVAIPHAAVTLILCEKSAMTYYLEEGKVKSVPTAD
jgi:hypothetical protein